MTQPTNTFDSYDSIGNKEDVRDIIYNIDPTATPFLSNCGRGTARNTYHEWQTDVLTAAAQNALVEGDDVTAVAATPTVRLGNYTQIAGKAVTIADTLEAVDRYGRAKEMSYQLALRSKEIKRDMENDLCSNNARAAGNATTARESAGLGAWIANNDVFQTGGTPSSGASPTGDGTDARTDNSTQAALTEDNLNTAIRNAWVAGGEPDMIMCGPVNKVNITAFTGNATKYKDVQDKKVINAVDVYVSDFGEMSVVPNRFQRERDVFVLDMDMWDVAYLREFRTYELAKTGAAEKRAIDCEYTLVSKNEKASAGVFDCTTTVT